MTLWGTEWSAGRVAISVLRVAPGLSYRLVISASSFNGLLEVFLGGLLSDVENFRIVRNRRDERD